MAPYGGALRTRESNAVETFRQVALQSGWDICELVAPRQRPWGTMGDPRLSGRRIPEVSHGKTWGEPSHMLNVWYIDLQNWVFFGANVGKYSSTMEHMGMGKHGEIIGRSAKSRKSMEIHGLVLLGKSSKYTGFPVFDDTGGCGYTDMRVKLRQLR